MSAVEKPTLSGYIVNLLERFEKHGPMIPTVLAVAVLGYAAEDERIDEHERALCKHWLSRLVDEEGNPLDDQGRNAMEWAFEENAINFHGTLSSVVTKGDRTTMSVSVLRRVAEQKPRDEVRAALVPHAVSCVDHLLDALYDDGELDAEQAAEVEEEDAADARGQAMEP